MARFGIHQPIAIVSVDVQVIGDDLELVAGHLENFVVVDAHRRNSIGLEAPETAHGSWYLRCSGRSSNRILRAGGYAFKRESGPDPDSDGRILPADDRIHQRARCRRVGWQLTSGSERFGKASPCCLRLHV